MYYELIKHLEELNNKDKAVVSNQLNETKKRCSVCDEVFTTLKDGDCPNCGSSNSIQEGTEGSKSDTFGGDTGLDTQKDMHTIDDSKELDDVTQMPVIGHIVTLEQSPYVPSMEYDVVDIMQMSTGDKIYVTNQWYKEHKKIPQLVPAMFVKQYTPVVAETDTRDDDPSNLEQNKPFPVVFGLG